MIGSVTLVIPITDPAQLSMAVGAASEFTEHCAITSGKKARSGKGGTLSTTTSKEAHSVILQSPRYLT